jgi:hypothetical protein
MSKDGLRNASVIASPTSDVEMLCLSREHYHISLMSFHQQGLEMEEKIATLRGLGSIFSSWQRSRLIVLSYVMQRRVFPRNSYLCKQGEIGDEVFLISKGEVQLQLSLKKQTTGGGLKGNRILYEERSMIGYYSSLYSTFLL